MRMTEKIPVLMQPMPPPPKVAFGRGCYLTDVNGKLYIDGSGGPAVYCIGHGNEEVNAAILAQLSVLHMATGRISTVMHWKS